MAGKDTRVALWYYRHYQVHVEMFDSEREAATMACVFLDDGGAAPEGAQFPDGRFVQLSEWALYEQVKQERYEQERRREPVQRPATRTVLAPWEYMRTTVEIPADLPEWVGRKADA